MRLRKPRLIPRGDASRTVGQLVDIPYFSRLLERWRRFTVWLPPGYSGSTRRLPAVYLFRGHHTEWQRLYHTADDFRLLPHMPPMRVLDVWRVMEALVRTQTIPPLILVTPCMANDDGSLSGLATDWAAPHRIKGRQARGVGTGRFGRHLVEEIVPVVDRTFRTIAHRDGRATDGFSLGGFMALKLALSQLEMFSCAGAYDGSFFYLHHRPGGDEEGDYLMNNGLFDAVFDRPRRAEHVFQNSPAAILARAPDSLLRNTTFYLQCGPQQAEPMDSNFFRTMHVIRLLQMRGIPNRARPFVIEEGHHDWPTAFRHLAQALVCFCEVLARD